jgi:hypothetical protein
MYGSVRDVAWQEVALKTGLQSQVSQLQADEQRVEAGKQRGLSAVFDVCDELLDEDWALGDLLAEEVEFLHFV